LLTSGVDGEKNGPCNDGTNKADGEENLEETQEEVVVQRRVHQDVVIVETTEVGDPSKLGVRRLRSVLAGDGQNEGASDQQVNKTHYFLRSGR
jgi:hypothetical protein